MTILRPNFVCGLGAFHSFALMIMRLSLEGSHLQVGAGKWGFTRLGWQTGLPCLVILSTESAATPVHLILPPPFGNVDVHRAPDVEAYSV
jgi:hypothetical protein